MDDAKRRALFAEMLRRGGVPHRSEDQNAAPLDLLPVSDAQHRILNALEEPAVGPAYNNGILLRLQGPLEIERLEQGLNQIVKRHEAWRTAFVERDGVLCQRIDADVSLRIQRRDSTLEHFHQDASDDEGQPFDLARTPLVRAVLYRLAADDHALLVVAHHVVCDGWTVRLAIAELSAHYNAEKARRSESTPQQYRGYSARQRDWLESPEAHAQKAHWLGRLRGMRPIPFRTRSSASGADAKELERQLSRDVVDRLTELAQARRVSVFSLYVAALYMALAEVTGESDITIGTPMHNRLSASDKLVFGCCVNMQPLRIELAQPSSLDHVLTEAWNVCRDAVENQSLCVSRHVLDAEQKLNLVFEFLSEHAADTLRLDGLAISVVPLPRTVPRYDVQVLLDTREECRLSILYRAAQLDAEQLSSLVEHFERILREVANSADTR